MTFQTFQLEQDDNNNNGVYANILDTAPIFRLYCLQGRNHITSMMGAIESGLGVFGRTRTFSLTQFHSSPAPPKLRPIR